MPVRFLRLAGRAKWLYAGIAITAGLFALALYLVLTWDTPGRMVRDLVTRAAARDAAVQQELADTAEVVEFAKGLGAIGLPASVAISVSDLNSTTTGDAVSATWILRVSGKDGRVLATQEQRGVFALVNSSSGQRIHLVAAPGPAVRLSLSTLYPTAGSAESDATAIVDDLARGNAWIPGFSAIVVSMFTELHSDPIQTVDPDRTVAYNRITAMDHVGQRTTWTVTQSAPGFSDSVTAASAITDPPLPQESVRGAITLDIVSRNAVRDAAGALVKALESRDETALGHLLVPDVTLPGNLLNALSHAPPRTVHASAILLQDMADGAVAFDGDLAFVHTNAAWLLDPGRSQLAAWSSAGKMSQGRYGHSATLLADGRVLVAGGTSTAYSAGTTPLSSVELYDPATRAWKRASAMTRRRFFHSATLLADGSVLVAGGLSATGTTQPTASAELYDPKTGKWKATASMKVARWTHSATLLTDGRVLVAGGLGPTGVAIASAEVYDPRTGKWTATGRMHEAREAPAVLLTNGKVLISGGFGKDKRPIGSAERYDPTTGKWSLTGIMAGPRAGHAAVRLSDGRVLAISGEDTLFRRISSAEISGAAGEGWGYVWGLSQARFLPGAALLLDGRVLCVGGYTDTRPVASAELFDPTTLKWTGTDGLTTARYAAATVILPDGRVLVVGGLGQDNRRLSSAEVYTYWTKP